MTWILYEVRWPRRAVCSIALGTAHGTLALGKSSCKVGPQDSHARTEGFLTCLPRCQHRDRTYPEEFQGLRNSKWLRPKCLVLLTYNRLSLGSTAVVQWRAERYWECQRRCMLLAGRFLGVPTGGSVRTLGSSWSLTRNADGISLSVSPVL